MDRITNELLDAAREGEGALLSQIESINSNYLKLIVAVLVLQLSAPNTALESL